MLKSLLPGKLASCFSCCGDKWSVSRMRFLSANRNDAVRDRRGPRGGLVSISILPRRVQTAPMVQVVLQSWRTVPSVQGG